MANEITTQQQYIEGRGKDFCRGCLGVRLFSGLDLGNLPIANELLLNRNSDIEKFPLHLQICSDCGLGQVADVVTPERIFRDYRYLSSMSTTFLKHAADFVTELVKKDTFSPGDWVLEIASNDGYLLKNFLSYGIPAVGVEPAENVAEISQGLGIQTIPEFFSRDLAKEILSNYGYPRIVIANNVMAHVPDLIDFMKGLEVLCGPNTQISIENPSLANILVGMQFDTIYHEHYSYLSASAVSQISGMHGLQLYKIEELQIHGGSNRYWLKKLNVDSITETSVREFCKNEQDQGLFDIREWTNYTNRVSKILRDFREWLFLEKENGSKVYGYGAAAKASTILNSAQIEPDLILAIADVSLEKQKRFMPPYGIKIISPQELSHEKPTDIVIFPWNIKSEIATYLKNVLGDDVRLWCAIPNMNQVSIT